MALIICDTEKSRSVSILASFVVSQQNRDIDKCIILPFAPYRSRLCDAIPVWLGKNYLKDVSFNKSPVTGSCTDEVD